MSSVVAPPFYFVLFFLSNSFSLYVQWFKEFSAIQCFSTIHIVLLGPLLICIYKESCNGLGNDLGNSNELLMKIIKILTYYTIKKLNKQKKILMSQ